MINRVLFNLQIYSRPKTLDEKVYEIVNNNFQNTSSNKPKDINNNIASTSIKNQSISNSDFSKHSNMKDKQIHRTQSNGINVVKFENNRQTDKEMKLYSMQQLKHNIDLVIHGYLLKVMKFQFALIFLHL